jgi:hypothetical protein
VNLLITFLVTVTIAVVGAAWVGVVIDRMTSPFISLLVFFPVMFLAVWLAWRFAVKFTAPKATPSA